MGGRRGFERTVRVLAVLAGSAPLALLIVRFLRDDLGANPIEDLTHATGAWTLRFLLASLCITPLRRMTRWSWLARERRTLGLFAFLYGSLHLAIYAGLDLGLDFSLLAEDLRERPYITVGFATWVILLALALTSSRAAMRRMKRGWQRLHRLVYVAAIGGIVHFLWLVKADLREPLIYGAITALLLTLRLPRVRSALNRA
jgi:sulfoxide reductase heme-binding subunit YedZ